MGLPLPPPVIEQVEAQTPAIALFESTCFDGQVELKADITEKVTFNELPRDARHIFRYAMSTQEGLPGYSPLLSSSQAPSLIYRVGFESETYVTIPDNLTKTRYTSVCAVMIKGDRFEEALRSIRPGSDHKMQWPVNQLPYLSTFRDGYRITAARYNAWTILATVPEQSPTRE